jgi:shikimate kinase
VPPRVLLIGLPGTGKSSVGRRVAERLGVEFADSDSMIEVRAGRSIPRIFAEDGEAAFRQLEASVVADALTNFSGVLALGGGAVLTESTKQAIAASGIPVVLLHTQLATLANRVGTGSGRPLLADDPGHRLAELAAVREPVYRSLAALVVDTERRSTGRVAEVIFRLLDDLAEVREAPADE